MSQHFEILSKLKEKIFSKIVFPLENVIYYVCIYVYVCTHTYICVCGQQSQKLEFGALGIGTY